MSRNKEASWGTLLSALSFIIAWLIFVGFVLIGWIGHIVWTFNLLSDNAVITVNEGILAVIGLFPLFGAIHWWFFV